MKLSEFVNVDSVVTQVPPATVSFSKPALIGDFPEIPIDKVYREITQSSQASVLTTSAAAGLWASALWSQDLNIASAYIVRWISTAIAPRFVMTDAVQVVSAYNAITVSGSFSVTDGTTTEDFDTAPMDGFTTYAQVLAAIQAAVRTSSSFAADLSAAVVALDDLGRPYLETADTGESATTYSVVATGTPAGTDITAAGFLNIASRAFVVAGMDAEDMDDALARMIEAKNDFSIVHEIGGSVANQTSLAVAGSVYKKLVAFNVRDSHAKDAAQTDDLAYALHAASNNWSFGIYTEWDNAFGWPAAAVNGQILPRPPGSASGANNLLNNVNESGKGTDGTSVIPLTPDERAALDDKGCDYIVEPIQGKHCAKGLTFGGLEIKTRVGLMWAEYMSMVEIASYLYQNEVTFNDADINAIAGIILNKLAILVQRKCLASYAANIPLASSISLSVQAAHNLDLSEVASAIAAYAINTVTASIKVAA